MAEHADAPWGLDEFDQGGRKVFYVSTLAGNHIGVIDAEEFDNETTEANALLIAAAPDLLEACKAFAAWDEHTYGGEADAAFLRRKIAAAIAKATGQGVPS